MKNSSLVVVDVEVDGPIPFRYSMVSFGAVIVENGTPRSFYAQTAPISSQFVSEALAVSGFSREQHETFPAPEIAMQNFAAWLAREIKGRPIFVSDNLAFDWSWINWYFHEFTGANPFGFSGRRIGDFYAGVQRDWFAASKWKSLRQTAHTHHPVDDARGNAQALLQILAMCKAA